MLWCGNIKNSWKECEVDIQVNIYHMNGVEIEDMLPTSLAIENRLDLKELHKYLPKLSFSSSRNMTICYFQPKSVEHLDDYRKLFAYLKSINRGGVFSTNKDFFQELYVFPLAKEEEIPSLISKIDLDIKEDLLIGVFLSDRRVKKRKPEVNLKNGLKRQKLSKSPNSYEAEDMEISFEIKYNHQIDTNDSFDEQEPETQNRMDQINLSSVDSLKDTLQILTSGLINNTTPQTNSYFVPNLNSTNFTSNIYPTYPFNSGQVSQLFYGNMAPWSNNSMIPQPMTLGITTPY